MILKLLIFGLITCKRHYIKVNNNKMTVFFVDKNTRMFF